MSRARRHASLRPPHALATASIPGCRDGRGKSFDDTTHLDWQALHSVSALTCPARHRSQLICKGMPGSRRACQVLVRLPPGKSPPTPCPAFPCLGVPGHGNHPVLVITGSDDFFMAIHPSSWDRTTSAAGTACAVVPRVTMKLKEHTGLIPAFLRCRWLAWMAVVMVMVMVVVMTHFLQALSCIVRAAQGFPWASLLLEPCLVVSPVPKDADMSHKRHRRRRRTSPNPTVYSFAPGTVRQVRSTESSCREATRETQPVKSSAWARNAPSFLKELT